MISFSKAGHLLSESFTYGVYAPLQARVGKSYVIAFS
jgi:hypothetical protein